MDTSTYISGLRERNDNIIVQLYKESFHNVKLYVLRYGGTVEEANQLLWDCIEKLRIQCLKPNFTLNGRIHGYLFVICKNTWKRQKKKTNKEKSTVLFSDLQIKGEETYLDLFLPDNSMREDLRMEVNNLKNTIRSLRKKLSEKCQEVIEFFYFQEMTHKEIAVKLDMKESSVRKRKMDCNKSMRKVVLSSSHLTDLMDYIKY